mmetsp:Transcript_34596/g.62274  ORF Transcript_34596/g.62274 Transcript_34596/m.62274 type:complete len:131 (-) Transcript_34596:918-1310(-)
MANKYHVQKLFLIDCVRQNEFLFDIVREMLVNDFYGKIDIQTTIFAFPPIYKMHFQRTAYNAKNHTDPRKRHSEAAAEDDVICTGCNVGAVDVDRVPLLLDCMGGVGPGVVGDLVEVSGATVGRVVCVAV